MNEIDSVAAQRERYDAEAVAYEQHHGDPINQKYRDCFVRKRLFSFGLAGQNVLEAMCASGMETGFLLDRKARVVGLDVSAANAELFRRRWNMSCHVCSIHATNFVDESFDVVYICGGLHHVLPILSESIAEVHRILKPGGRFCFLEPNRDTWLDLARRVWYRADSRFHDSERALSYGNDLRPYLEIGFEEESVAQVAKDLS